MMNNVMLQIMLKRVSYPLVNVQGSSESNTYHHVMIIFCSVSISIFTCILYFLYNYIHYSTKMDAIITIQWAVITVSL